MFVRRHSGDTNTDSVTTTFDAAQQTIPMRLTTGMLFAFVVLSSISPVSADTVITQSQPVAVVIDDTAPGWIWTQGEEIENSLLYGGSAHTLPPGSQGVYSFSGTGVKIYTMAGPAVSIGDYSHRLGNLDVYIDGTLQKSCPQEKASTVYGYLALDATGLANRNHVLELRAKGGWAVIDDIKIETTASNGPDSSTNVPDGYTDVTFQIDNCYPTNGQRVIVLGNIPPLGNWQADHGLTLTYAGNSPVPSWTARVRLPAGIAIQYKYGIWDGSRLIWETSRATQSGNHEVVVPASGEVTFTDGNFVVAH